MSTTENKVIIPTGYMGSGSSAILDFLNEFETYQVAGKDLEYIFLHCPNGVFDLEDKLLKNNNGIRCDEALRTFSSMMEALYSTPFWWVSDYKHKVTKNFMDLVHEYVNELTLCESACYWWYQERRGWGAFPRLAINKIIKVLTNERMMPKKPLIYEGMHLSIPTEEEFYSASKKFLRSFFSEMGIDRSNLIFDVLIQPSQLCRFENYFDENVECFVVDRDPRDVFLSNKYIWTKHNVAIPYPLDARDFCDYYKRLRAIDAGQGNSQTHRIHFEDMVYRYEETTREIRSILNISDADGAKPRALFDPARSINNTQLFSLPEFQEESTLIERLLPEYLYDFPYERTPELEETF